MFVFHVLVNADQVASSSPGADQDISPELAQKIQEALSAGLASNHEEALQLIKTSEAANELTYLFEIILWCPTAWRNRLNDCFHAYATHICTGTIYSMNKIIILITQKQKSTGLDFFVTMQLYNE